MKRSPAAAQVPLALAAPKTSRSFKVRASSRSPIQVLADGFRFLSLGRLTLRLSLLHATLVPKSCGFPSQDDTCAVRRLPCAHASAGWRLRRKRKTLLFRQRLVVPPRRGSAISHARLIVAARNSSRANACVAIRKPWRLDLHDGSSSRPSARISSILRFFSIRSQSFSSCFSCFNVYAPPQTTARHFSYFC